MNVKTGAMMVGAIVLAIWGGVVYGSHTAGASSASEIVSHCSSERDRQACYEREVPALFPKLNVPQVFSVVREVRAQDPSYQFCHVLAHKLGERVVAEDQDKWMYAMSLNPADGMCSNGFVHGVIVGRFRSEVLTDETLKTYLPQFAAACEPRSDWSPSTLDQAICYHGMGHLFMFVTNAVVPKALSLCEQTATGKNPNQDFRQVCREGVFMQIYQPLEPDDFALVAQMKIKPATTTVRAYCDRFSAQPEYEGACLRESWPYNRQSIMDGSGIDSFCAHQPNVAEENHCYDSAFAILGRQSLGHADRVAVACGKVKLGRQAQCFISTAGTIVEEDRSAVQSAIALCEKGTGDIATQCITALIDRAPFVFRKGSPEIEQFCRAVPSEYTSLCESRIRSSL